MMTASRLEKAQWHSYFDTVSKTLSGTRVEIEIEPLAMPLRFKGRWLTLSGIFYDPGSDALLIACDDLNHIIEQPRDVFVNEAEQGISMEVVDANASPCILKLRSPLRLSTRELPRLPNDREFHGSGRR